MHDLPDCIHKDKNGKCCLYRPVCVNSDGNKCRDYTNKFSWEKKNGKSKSI